MSRFSDMASSFFDELEKIDKSRREAHDETERVGGRPFSTLLTQDEEPEEERARPAPSVDEPDVILGGYR